MPSGDSKTPYSIGCFAWYRARELPVMWEEGSESDIIELDKFCLSLLLCLHNVTPG